jgi:hypothetical protein
MLLFCVVLLQFEMGIYLSSPKTEKASEDGENEMLRFGLSSMQGWRATMEDAVTILFLLVQIMSFLCFVLCLLRWYVVWRCLLIMVIWLHVWEVILEI